MIDDFVFFFQAEDGIRDKLVTGVQTCALPISPAAPVHPDPSPAPACPANCRPLCGRAMPCKPKHIHRALRTDNAQQKFDPPSTCPGCSAMELPRTAPCKHQIAIRDNRPPPSAHQNAHKKVASLGADKNPASQTPCPPKSAPKPAAPPATSP